MKGSFQRFLFQFSYPQFQFSNAISKEVNINDKELNNIIDAPCGNGETSYLIAKNCNKQVEGFDLDSDSIMNAKTNFGRPNLSYGQADIHALVLKKEKFEVFCMINSLFLLPRVDDLLEVIRKKLVDSGSFYVVIPNTKGNNFIRFSSSNPNINSLLINESEIELYFNDRGFKIKAVKPLCYSSWLNRKFKFRMGPIQGVYLMIESHFRRILKIGPANYFLIVLKKR